VEAPVPAEKPGWILAARPSRRGQNRARLALERLAAPDLSCSVACRLGNGISRAVLRETLAARVGSCHRELQQQCVVSRRSGGGDSATSP